MERNPTDGRFTLKLGLKRSNNLIKFDPFPVNVRDLSGNGSGKIVFEFKGTDETAFFQLQAE